MRNGLILMIKKIVAYRIDWVGNWSESKMRIEIILGCVEEYIKR